MPKRKEKKGGDLYDAFSDPIGTLKEAFQDIPTKLNNISRRTMEKYGHEDIQTITAIRTPLGNIWGKTLNYLSNNRFDELTKKNNIDTLYHLSLLIRVSTDLIIIEKNEVVNIRKFSPSDVDEKTEYLNVPVNKKITLNEFVNNAIEYMGEHNFYDYDGLGNSKEGANNCQNFTKSLLHSNGLLTSENLKFMVQDLTALNKDLENSDAKNLSQTVKKITNMGSFVSRLVAKGMKEHKTNKRLMNFVKFVKNDGYKFL